MKYIKLHATIWVYSITSVLIKVASQYPILSKEYIFTYALMVLDLGVFALLWQQAIKDFEPSVAYSNKSVTTIWTIIYAIFIFGEKITVNKAIGAALIIIGIVIATKKKEEVA